MSNMYTKNLNILVGMKLHDAQKHLFEYGINKFLITITKSPRTKVMEGTPWVVRVNTNGELLELVVTYVNSLGDEI